MSRAHSSAPNPTPAVATDFPDWLDPMVVKELRQGLRARMFVVPFVAVQAAALSLVWLEYLATRTSGTLFTSSPIGHILFWGLVFIAVAIVLPLRGLTGLSEEMAGGNSGLVALAGMSRWKIVLGKWFTQMVLATLILVSLTPYALVRYFFGGVELTANLAALANAVGCAGATNALFIGASGYASYGMRALIAGVALAYLGVVAATGLSLGTIGIIQPSASDFIGQLWALALILGLALTYAYFTLCGLQLARARLRLALLPWEVPPSRPALALFVLSPFYFGFGLGVTCGLGFPLVAGLMVWLIGSLDRPPLLKGRRHAWQPAPNSPPPLPPHPRF